MSQDDENSMGEFILTYDLIMSRKLDSISFSCQWVPEMLEEYLLLLISTSDPNGPNYVKLAAINLPTEPGTNKKKDYYYLGSTRNRFDFSSMVIEQEGTVKKFRMMTSTGLMAVKTEKQNIQIFNLASQIERGFHPNVTLRGYKVWAEDCGVEWSYRNGNHLAASFDRMIFIYDVKAKPLDGLGVRWTNELTGHKATVNDLDWSPTDENMLLSASSDKDIMLWDTRVNNQAPCRTFRSPDNHGPVNCIQFNPHRPSVVGTGSANGFLAHWDIRSTQGPVHDFGWHEGEVRSLKWSRRNLGSDSKDLILASAGTDGRVQLWDILNRDTLGDSHGPSELLFVHNGNNGQVLDVDWHPKMPWLLSSVSNNGVVQVWQVCEDLRDSFEGKDEFK